MTQVNRNTNSQSGKHLTYEERIKIEAYKELNYSNRKIARILGRAPQTINNAVNNGTVRTIKQRQKHGDKVYEYDQYSYSADADHQNYLNNRLNCGRRPKWLDDDSFINWADEMMLGESWSPDSVVGHAKEYELFPKEMIPCTSTLYKWIDRGIMKTKNIDLLEKVSRKPRNDSPKTRKHRRVLGPSIEERPDNVETRQHFGHWEIDTLVGARTHEDPVLLTLVERKTRLELILKLKQQSQADVDQAINDLRKQLGKDFGRIFQTITADNGSEFAGLYENLLGTTDVYFARPYASYERGTKENQHKLIRRFIPKSKRLAEISTNTIKKIQQWMNNLPRKILGYRTAKEAFKSEIKLLTTA